MPLRRLGDKTAIKDHGPSNAVAPHISRPVINQNPQNPGQQPLHHEMYPKQLNPISSTPGMPQYKDQVPSQHLMALIAALRGY